MAWAWRAACGHNGGTSAMPSRYRSNETVTVTVSVPSSARPTVTEPGYRASNTGCRGCLHLDATCGNVPRTRNDPLDGGTIVTVDGTANGEGAGDETEGGDVVARGSAVDEPLER